MLEARRRNQFTWQAPVGLSLGLHGTDDMVGLLSPLSSPESSTQSSLTADWVTVCKPRVHGVCQAVRYYVWLDLEIDGSVLALALILVQEEQNNSRVALVL